MNVSPYMFELGWLILGYLFALLLFLIVFFMIVRSAQKLYDSVIAPERALAIVRCGQNVKGVAHWMSPSDSLVVVAVGTVIEQSGSSYLDGRAIREELQRLRQMNQSQTHNTGEEQAQLANGPSRMESSTP
jgi:hypothetical protein